MVRPAYGVDQLSSPGTGSAVSSDTISFAYDAGTDARLSHSLARVGLPAAECSCSGACASCTVEGSFRAQNMARRAAGLRLQESRIDA